MMLIWHSSENKVFQVGSLKGHHRLRVCYTKVAFKNKNGEYQREMSQT